jgi:DNA excision repair protein ERCC-2
MHFSLDDRTCALSVGEFAAFTLGPRDAGSGGPAGVWRAQLGQLWHSRLRAQTSEQVAAGGAAAAVFEVPLTLAHWHRGWEFTFSGRADQIVATPEAMIIREIKTVTSPLPAELSLLRSDYADYFVQVLTYLTLLRSLPLTPSGAGSPSLLGLPGLEPLAAALPPSARPAVRAELIFVEVATGLAQTVALSADDESIFHAQLERLLEFLQLRVRARERLRALRFRPAFAALRPGQESIQEELTAQFELP